MVLRAAVAAIAASCAICLVACHAAAGSSVVAPCEGCTIHVPARAGPRPLLVVLHGNSESARAAAERWRPAALRRGWMVLSLQCPRARGCTEASWYKWGGPARWVLDQIEAIEPKAQIDPRRIYLAGWSGGATFIGSNVPAWAEKVAAMVFHGGGQPPSSDECPDRPIPAYFLVGDRNPSHSAVLRLRAYLEACGQELRWDARGGADHDDEDRMLHLAKANAILDWLASRPRAARE
jgi:poly(3-hydroxybutyrate) depolymerase